MSHNNGYSLDFKLFLEGIDTPFKSASIASTPGGNQASVNIYSNALAHKLVPKTSVQIFFKEWTPGYEGDWRIMFDGYFSLISEGDSATDGRMMTIVCRDFVNDLGKIPAAIVYDSMNDLTATNGFTMAGLHHTIVTKEKRTKQKKRNRQTTRVYNGQDNYALIQLSESLKWIAAGAQGGISKIKADGTSIYKRFTPTMNYRKGNADGGLFLDSFSRGLWSESIGGSNVAAFLNKRIRADKKMLIPRNEAGYRMWTENQGNTQIGSYLMGNAKFSSVAAAIMRVSGLFATRMFSCSTPTAIFIGDKDMAGDATEEDSNTKNVNTDAVAYVMDERVKEFMVDENEEEFGGKYLLNEFMLLPSLEFTAPPSCNVIAPSMYNGITWHHDYDVDITRGMYKQADLFGGAATLSAMNIQVPNALFNIGGKDSEGRNKLPLTYEEREKGISVDYGQVAYKEGMDDALSVFKGKYLNKDAKADLDVKIQEIKDKISNIEESAAESKASKAVKEDLQERLKAKVKARNKRKTGTTKMKNDAIRRHALIRFLNKKYGGRVMNINMMFNPYVMSGFPAVILAGDDASDEVQMMDITGQIQQVQHSIVIGPGGADASTSIVLNGARFVDDPTDISPEGNPLYAEATSRHGAEIDDDLNYKEKHFVGDSKQRVGYVEDFDWKTKMVYTTTAEVVERKDYNAGTDAMPDFKVQPLKPSYDAVMAEFDARWEKDNNVFGVLPKDPVKRVEYLEGLVSKEFKKREAAFKKALKHNDDLFDERAKEDRALIAEARASRMEKRENALSELERIRKSKEGDYTEGEYLGAYNSGDTSKLNEMAVSFTPASSRSFDDEEKGLQKTVVDNYKFRDPVVQRTRTGKKVSYKSWNYNPYDMQDVSKGLRTTYKYAKDVITRTSEDEARGETNLKFVDEAYTPNRIAKFYKDVFGEVDSIMYDTYVDAKGRTQRFMYDTIHEAVESFRKSHSGVLNDYNEAIKFSRRPICSADEFFGGILGASVKDGDKYIVRTKPEDMNHSRIEDRYYGISSEKFPKIHDKLKYPIGLIEGPGQNSSITENIPLTPFIEEREQAVKDYINSVTSARNHAPNIRRM